MEEWGKNKKKIETDVPLVECFSPIIPFFQLSNTPILREITWK